MNTEYRKPLPGTELEYFDTRAAVDAIQPGAYAKLPYTSRILAEQLVRRCAPQDLTDALKQLIERNGSRAISSPNRTTSTNGSTSTACAIRAAHGWR